MVGIAKRVLRQSYLRDGRTEAAAIAVATSATFTAAAFPGGVPANIDNFDWIDAVSQTGKNAQYDFSVSGGDAKTKFFISGSFNNNDGTTLPIPQFELNENSTLKSQNPVYSN